MQKYRAKLQRYTIILTIITLIVSGIFITCVLNNVSKMLLLTLFLLLFFSLSSLISVIFMLYLPRLEKFLAKRRKQKRPLTKSDRNASILLEDNKRSPRCKNTHLGGSLCAKHTGSQRTKNLAQSAPH